MPIQFSTLLQDSWNFLRNRFQFTFYALILLTTLQASISLLFPRLTSNLNEMQAGSEMVMSEMLQGMLLPSFLSLLATTFVNVLLILNISAINNGSYTHFFQQTNQTLVRFLPVVALSFMQYLPLSLGVSAILFSQNSEMSLLMLPLFITGIYVFIKLILTVYVYLIETPQKGIGETLSFTWRLSRGKMFPLVILFMIVYIIPMFLSGFILNGASLAGEVVRDVIAHFFGSLINLFVTILTFRFYQHYRQV